MTTQVTNYQCPTCTGSLQYDTQSGKLRCDYCQSAYETSEIEQFYAKKEKEATEAFEAQAPLPTQATPHENSSETAEKVLHDNVWDTSKLQSNWGDDEKKMRSYSCPSCGAEIICDETTAATSCLYCGNPTVVPGQFSGTIRPDFIIPFKLNKEAAKLALKQHCKGKFLLPKVFLKEAHIDEIKGAYVPLWLFDGNVYANVHYNATRSSVRDSGQYRITTTHHFKVHRAGTITFQDIPVDASSKMPDIYMESIEPYDYKELKPFSTAYMPGFLADKYDVAVEQCVGRADERAIQSALDVMRRSVSGYTSCIESEKQTNLHRGDVQYAMVPVWMLSTRWRGKVFLFAMNGQTGKLIGDLPCNWAKFWAFVLGLTTAFTALGSIIWFWIL